jgi:hypothetical protein
MLFESVANLGDAVSIMLAVEGPVSSVVCIREFENREVQECDMAS